MAKAILVLDKKERCNECEFSALSENGSWFCDRKIRGIPDMDSKPDWCPLVEMPKRKHVNWTINIDGKQEPIKDKKAEGWNACLDALEGKENERLDRRGNT